MAEITAPAPSLADARAEAAQFLDEWLGMGASAEQVAKLIQLDVRQGYEQGANACYLAVHAGVARLEGLRRRTGHRATLPREITRSVGL